jgi:TolB protein
MGISVRGGRAARFLIDDMQGAGRSGTKRPPKGAILVPAAIFFIVFVAGVLRATSDCSAQTEVSLTIRESRAITIPLGIEDLSTANGLPEEADLARLLQRVIYNDLDLSGLFDLHKFSISEPETSYADLRAVVKGRVGQKGKKFYLEGWLEEYPSGRSIFVKKWTFAESLFRKAAHKFADDIVLFLTGESGIAQTKIAYVFNDGESQELYVMDYDGYGKRALTAHKSICISPAWSHDGESIAYTGFRKGNPDLFGIKRTGGKSWTISNRGGINSAAAYSPDGKSIAFTMTKDGNAEIYVADKDGSKPRRLTTNRAIDSSPTWSPSGRQIAFTSGRSGTPQIYIMDADGTNVRRLTYDGTLNDSPDWSPRGDRIAYVTRREGRMEIASVSVFGGIEQLLTWGTGNNENPRWAPDGRHLCFSSTRSGRREIFLMNDDGSGHRLITSGPGEKFCPTWSPRLQQ